ncbi:MAG TPA: autotransporter-associated beta strand repeat-containing protein [Tepidisphaeraceae bacterium]
MKRRRLILSQRRVLAAAVAGAALAGSGSARAQYIWTNTAGGNWSTASNWSGNVAPPTIGGGSTTLQFDNSGSSSYTANYDANSYFNLNQLTFNSSSSGAISLTSGTLGFTNAGGGIVQNGVGTAIINQNIAMPSTMAIGGTGTGDVHIAGAISASSGGTLTKTGSFTLALSGNNTSGGWTTTFSGGTLRAESAQALNPGAIFVSGGGVIENSAAFTTFTRSLSPTTNGLFFGGSGGFSARGADFNVSFAGTVNKTWGGPGFVPSGHTLVLGAATSNRTVNFNNGISLNGGTRTISVARGTGSTPEANIKGMVFGGALNKIGSGTLQLSGNLPGPGAPPLTLSLSGGTTILTGSNSYSGATTVNGAVLRIGGAYALSPVTNVSLTNSGILEGSASFTSLNRTLGTSNGQLYLGDGGFAATGENLSVNLNGGTGITWGMTSGFNPAAALGFGSVNADRTATLQNHLNLNWGVRTLAVTAGVGTLPEGELASGVSSGHLVKSGAGTLLISGDIKSFVTLTNSGGLTILSGNNDYYNPTTINSGTVRIGSATGLSASSNLNFNGGVLEGSAAFNTFTRTLGSANNAVQFTGSGGFSASGSDLTVALNNSNQNYIWGSSAFFVPNNASLICGSPKADKTVIFTNGIDGGGTDRTIYVHKGVGTTPEVKFTGNIVNNGMFRKDGPGTAQFSSNIGSLGGLENVAGTTVLSGINNYGGRTTVSGGILRLESDGALSSSSNLTLSGGVVQYNLPDVVSSVRTIARTLGTSGGMIQWTGSGGFSARSGSYNVTLSNPGGGALVWGSGGFVPDGSSLLFGSPDADATVVFTRSIDLGGGTRTISVSRGVGTAAEVRFPPNTLLFNGALVKTGEGTMQVDFGMRTMSFTNAAGTTILKGTNTYSGTTSVSGGTVRLEASAALSQNSNLVLSGGGVIENSTAYTGFFRTTGAGPGLVQWTGDGGFAAVGADLTVYTSSVSWGNNGFVPNGSQLIIGSPRADHTVMWTSDINLNGGVRTFNIVKGTGSATEARFSGPLTNGGIIKKGAGVMAVNSANALSSVTLADGVLMPENSFSFNYSGTQFTFDGGTLATTFAGSVSGQMNVASGGVVNTTGSAMTFFGNVAGTGALTKIGAGTLSLGAVNVGALTLNADTPGKTIIRPRSVTGTKNVLRVNSLSIGAGSTLDLNDNDLVVSSGNFAAILSMVFQGYRTGPDSAATGIISSTGQTTVGNPVLAVFDNALVGASDFPFGSGQTLGAKAIAGKYTFIGDADFNGMVTPDDYGAVDSNLGVTVVAGEGWFKGDFNFDGVITPDDYLAIDANLGNGEGNPLAAMGMAALGNAAVPEPSVLGVVMAGVVGMRRRWKTRNA